MTKTVNKTIFVKLMESEGLNQAELAKRLNISTHTVSRLMNGEPPKRPKKRKEIANTVAADVDYVFPEIGEDKLAS
jgi:transcriptional regulator with XRE-family HTH domain